MQHIYTSQQVILAFFTDTQTMLYPILAILAGFALLVWSSDIFVDGSAAIARLLGVSPLVIGITIVGFGTSAPEMLISTFAALDGAPQLAIGNAIGSNIANIALVLGVTTIMCAVRIESRLLKLELPILLGAMVFGYIMISDGFITALDAILLFVVLIAILSWLVRDAMSKRGGKEDALAAQVRDEIEEEHLGMGKAIAYFTAGLAILLASSKMLVWGATIVATHFGVSELVIGLTIVAIGTSLPELAASISSARKGEADIAIGNVIGSNLFNILAVMAIPGLIAKTTVPQDALSRDYPIMLVLTIIMVLLAFRFGREQASIGRLAGIGFFTAFIAYQVMLFAGVR